MKPIKIIDKKKLTDEAISSLMQALLASEERNGKGLVGLLKETEDYLTGQLIDLPDMGVAKGGQLQGAILFAQSLRDCIENSRQIMRDKKEVERQRQSHGIAGN